MKLKYFFVFASQPFRTPPPNLWPSWFAPHVSRKFPLQNRSLVKPWIRALHSSGHLVCAQDRLQLNWVCSATNFCRDAVKVAWKVTRQLPREGPLSADEKLRGPLINIRFRPFVRGILLDRPFSIYKHQFRFCFGIHVYADYVSDSWHEFSTLRKECVWFGRRWKNERLNKI